MESVTGTGRMTRVGMCEGGISSSWNSRDKGTERGMPWVIQTITKSTGFEGHGHLFEEEQINMS